MTLIWHNIGLSNYLKLLINHGRSFSSQFQPSIEAVPLSFTKYCDSKSDLEPIIIMHGLFGSKTNWNSIAKALNKQTKREIFCVDARNHGLSPHSPDMTYHHMAKDLEMFLVDRGIPSAVVAGHSMGGRAAMCLAFTKPSVISQLCVVDISPLYTSPSLATMKIYLETLRNLDIPKNMPLSECRKLVDKLLTPNVQDPRIRSFLITNLDTSNAESPWRVNIPVIDANFESQIAVFPKFPPETKFNKPTLFIAGRESDYIKPETTTEISKLFTNASYFFLANAAHWVHADQPTTFVNILAAWVKT